MFQAKAKRWAAEGCLYCWLYVTSCEPYGGMLSHWLRHFIRGVKPMPVRLDRNGKHSVVACNCAGCLGKATQQMEQNPIPIYASAQESDGPPERQLELRQSYP